MLVGFRSSHLQRCFEDEVLAVRAWGQVAGKGYVRVIRILTAVRDFRDLYRLSQLRLHPLHGSRSGEYAMTLSGRWRVIVTLEEPGVVVEEVTNHYGD